MVEILPLNTAGIEVYQHYCFVSGNTTSKLTWNTDCAEMIAQDKDTDTAIVMKTATPCHH